MSTTAHQFVRTLDALDDEQASLLHSVLRDFENATADVRRHAENLRRFAGTTLDFLDRGLHASSMGSLAADFDRRMNDRQSAADMAVRVAACFGVGDAVREWLNAPR